MNVKFYLFTLGFLFSFTVFGQCELPTNISVNDITSSTATVNWDESVSSPGVGYQFEVRTSGAPGSGASGLFLSGNVEDGLSSVALEGLLVDQNFMLYLRFQCNTLPTFSAWSAGVSFTTLEIQAPVAIDPFYVSNESFVAGWLNTSGAVNYLLDVSENSDFSTFVIEDQLVSITSFVVLNVIPETDYFYRVRAQSNNNTVSGYSNVIAVTTLADPLPFVVWTEAGWSSDPLIDFDAIIDFDYNTSEAFSFECKSLTVNEGYVLTISDGNSVIVVEEIIIMGENVGIIVENNANLVQFNDFADDNQGKIKVLRDSSPLFRLDYTMWSSPTSSPLNTSPQTLKSFSPGTLNNRFYTYNTTNNNFLVVDDPETTSFQQGLGYLIRIRNSHVPYVDENSVPEIWTGEFTGVPNNGFIEVPVSDAGQRFNMIGNPYPSVISAEDFIGLNFSNIDGTLYFWRRKNVVGGGGDTGTFYASYTLGGATTTSPTSEVPNGFIQVGQGFLVQAEDGVSEVEFSNELRVADQFGNQFFRLSQQSEKHRLWLNLTNNQGVFSQMMLGYIQNATNEYDKGYDAKPFSDSNVSITSLQGNTPLTIQAKSLPFSSEDMVAVQLNIVTAGEYQIALSNFDGVFESDQDIYLFDALLNVYHDLKSGHYSFATPSGVISDRFQIRFTNETLSIGNQDLNADDVIVYVRDQKLHLKSLNNEMMHLEVIDMMGRRLSTISNIDNFDYSVDKFTSHQFLVLKITLSNSKVVTKKIFF